MKESNDVLLKHYGVKGMKWGVQRTDKQTAKTNEGGGGSSEENEDILDNLLDKLKTNFGEINDVIKENGKKLLASIFGESKTSYKLLDLKKTDKIGKLKKAPNPFVNKDGSVKREFKESLNKRTYPEFTGDNKIRKKLESQGYKLQKNKSSKSLEERGYTFRTSSSNKDTQAIIDGYKKKGFKKHNDTDVLITTNHALDDILQHHGVKGMKWGVRKDKKRGKIGEHLDSLKRERQWSKALRNMDDMTTDEIKLVATRISLENGLKKMSRSKIANARDKSDYLNRSKLSDQEIAMKLTRLRAKDALHREVISASKEQRAFGVKVVQVGGSLAVKYATTKSVKPKDLFDAVQNPKSSADKAKEDVLKTIMERSKVKE